METPPLIDGVLDDDAWSGDPLRLGDWISYNPLRGDSTDIRTDVRIVYDDRYIYFAFHAFDEDPAKIRSTIGRRDTVFSDDWVAMSLDSAGTRQLAYHLFVNPSGVQMDALNTSASGEQFEADLLWDSIGRRTADGYVVEIRLPLQSIRFTGGSDVRMGIMFFRKVSRTGVSYSFPPMPAGTWVFENHAHLVFERLQSRRLVEVLPSVTYGVSQARESPAAWPRAHGDPSLGVSAKLGISSNMILDATINPDFSQVESDAFQVQVNQRFPIFYSEKRPFFMEGMGLFNVAGSGFDGNMRTSVHTRRVIDPAWGAKLTGTAGRTTVGFLSASDHAPEDIGDRGAAIAGHDKTFTLARATYALGGSNYVGALATDTELAGVFNRVQGADLSLRFSAPQQFSATILASETGGVTRSTHGIAAQTSYQYGTRRFAWSGQLEHYDRDFRMDTAFYNRTGFTSSWSQGEVHLYPNAALPWVKRVSPYYWSKLGYDDVQQGREDAFMIGVRLAFTRQGFLNVSHRVSHEPWQGHRYDTGGRINAFATSQITRWLRFNTSFNRSHDIYYDTTAPFQGQSVGGGLGLTLQPGAHFEQNIRYDGIWFDRAVDATPVYRVHIVNTQTTYQFDRHFRIRLLEQFDSSLHRLLTDALAMYEFVPGTVVHGGYGSLYERRQTSPVVANSAATDLRYFTVNRGLFFKVSYLKRF